MAIAPRHLLDRDAETQTPPQGLTLAELANTCPGVRRIGMASDAGKEHEGGMAQAKGERFKEEQGPDEAERARRELAAQRARREALGTRPTVDFTYHLRSQGDYVRRQARHAVARLWCSRDGFQKTKGFKLGRDGALCNLACRGVCASSPIALSRVARGPCRVFRLHASRPSGVSGGCGALGENRARRYAWDTGRGRRVHGTHRLHLRMEENSLTV